MYLVATITAHARSMALGFARHSRVYTVFQRLIEDWHIQLA